MTPSTGRRVTLLLLLALLTPTAVEARARRTAAIKPMAKKHLDEGIKLYNIQRYAESVAEFQAGYAIDPKPDFLFAIGQAERLGGDCKSAVTAYEAYLRSSPSKQRVQSTKTHLQECRDKLAAETPPPTVTPTPPVLTAPEPTTPPTATPRVLAPATTPPPIVQVPPGPPRPWYTDGVGDGLLVAGVALLVAGAVTWGLGYRTVSDLNGSTSYDIFDARAGGGGGALLMQQIGIAGAGVGAALVIASILRYTLHTRPAAATERSSQPVLGSAR